MTFLSSEYSSKSIWFMKFLLNCSVHSNDFLLCQWKNEGFGSKYGDFVEQVFVEITFESGLYNFCRVKVA